MTTRDLTTFSVLTFNIWGVFNARHNNARIKYLAEKKLHHYDIICLQENFNLSDFEVILEGINKAARKEHEESGGTVPLRLYTGHPCISSFVGSGLTLLTHFKVLSQVFLQFPVKGTAENIHHGDYFCNKGISVTRLQLPATHTNNKRTFAKANGDGDDSADGDIIVVYNTHLIACYQKYSKLNSFEDETNFATRLSQVQFIADTILATSRPEVEHILLCGDLNCTADSPEMKLLMGMLELRTQQRAQSKHDMHVMVKAVPTDNKTNFTYTIDNPYNSSATSYFQLLNLTEDMPVQLDHIFYLHHRHGAKGYGSPTGSPRAYGVAGRQSVLRMVPLLFGAESDNNNNKNNNNNNNKNTVDIYNSSTSNLTAKKISEMVVDVAPVHLEAAHTQPQGVVVFTANTVDVGGGVRRPMSDHYGVAARFALVDSRDEEWDTLEGYDSSKNGAMGTIAWHPIEEQLFFATDMSDMEAAAASSAASSGRGGQDGGRHGKPITPPPPPSNGQRDKAAAVRYALGVLERRRDKLARHAFLFQRAAIGFALLPLALTLLFNTMCDSHHSSGIGTFMATLSGFAAGICFIIGKVQRTNDAITLSNRVKDLKELLRSVDDKPL